MENENLFQSIFKEIWKMNLRESVSSSWDKYSSEMKVIIQAATDSVAGKIMDEINIEELARAAREGATHIAIRNMITKVTDDALIEAKPEVEKASKVFTDLMLRALTEAIKELVEEQLNKSVLK